VLYLCCYKCRLPQAIYSSFKIDVVNRRYRKQAGQRCRYRGVLEKTFIVATMRERLEVQRILEQAIREDR
jgi:hypothetical protein